MTPVEDPDEGAARATRKRRQRRSRGRWIYLAAGVLLLVMVVAAWNRQGDGTRQPDVPAGTGPQAVPKPALVPDRPSRDRPERPGEEREASRELAQREFRSADDDGDGHLSRSEVASRFPLIEREFERFDADHDGKISPQEFMHFRRFQARQQPQK